MGTIMCYGIDVVVLCSAFVVFLVLGLRGAGVVAGEGDGDGLGRLRG